MSHSTAPQPDALATPKHFARTWAEADTRTTPPLVGDEREILTSFLDFHRETFALKCAGVSAEALDERAVPPSALTLHGLVRHLAGAEQWWFETQFAGEPRPPLYYSDENPDQDFEGLDGDFGEDLEVWRKQCDISRRIVAGAGSLDETGIHLASGEPVSLRRILVHVIAEYARHNGHADLLRERIDGVTGY
ncbi:DinB family protein [Kitasatospora sp. NPDC049285]|uniref:DinB family protein n=1 Tax=Kitasatospora sp. NPDC049285 TaxID=3157096 RepID=UPI00341ED151